MCGISGFWGLNAEHYPEQMLKAMTQTLAHRGPDGEGQWWDEASEVGLGHRRLSIIDLSEAGHQPMASASDRFMMVFNGEIYNYQDLRRELDQLGATFNSESDTEVMLNGFEYWGIEGTLKKCVGMFAFALWDKKTHTLRLVRDRLGIKPLYWYQEGSRLAFASELKALKPYTGKLTLNRDALALLMRHNYVPAPYTIYQQVQKLKPGHMLKIERLKDGSFGIHNIHCWSLDKVVQAGQAHPLNVNEEEAQHLLHDQIREAVRLRMISDVPLGAFLSGGIDSSLVVSMMQDLSSRPIKTFTIGFAEAQFDESSYAKQVAQHLGTDHTEAIVTAAEAQAVIPRLPHLYDEPFADASQIPTFLVSQLARQQVAVSLSGDGGDELFGGYSRYALAHTLHQQMQRVPNWLWRAAGTGVRLTPTPLLNASLFWAKGKAQAMGGHGQVGDKLKKLFELSQDGRRESLYRALVSHWKQPEALVLNSHEPETVLTAELPAYIARLDDMSYMGWADTHSYLPDDILTKVDRASMGVSLEARVPLLDHRVVELAWRLPPAIARHPKRPKQLLKSILSEYVPNELYERPKQGFGVPVGEWIKDPLRDWAESLLDPALIKSQNNFDNTLLQAKWQEHKSGARQWQAHIWTVLMFQAWWQAEQADLSQSDIAEAA